MNLYVHLIKRTITTNFNMYLYNLYCEKKLYGSFPVIKKSNWFSTHWVKNQRI